MLLAVTVVLTVLFRQVPHAATEVCYVRPEVGNATCPYPCYTLREYTEERSAVVKRCRLGESETVYRFLGDGLHLLFDNISLSSDSVSLLGNWKGTHTVSHAEIVCKGPVGILFRNASNIVISGLSFTGCGLWTESLGAHATLAFDNVENVTISGVTVRNSSGYGLYSLCAMGFVQVNNSEFSYNGGTKYDGGNAGFVYENCSETPSLLSIKFSRFLYGYSVYNHSLATGLSMFLWTNGVNVEIDNITAVGNSGGMNAVGGNVIVILRNRTNVLTNRIDVRNSYIADGEAYSGGGLYISIYYTPARDSLQNTFGLTGRCEVQEEVVAPALVTIENTQFVGNHARHQGGGLYIITHEDPGVYLPLARVVIRDCLFTGNSLSSDFGGGVALHLTNHYVLGYLNHSEPQFNTSVVNCTVTNNSLISDISVGDVVFTASSAVFINQKPSGVLVEDSIITDNNCTGISTVKSAVVFSGKVLVARNNGTNGGGIILCDGGYMLLRANTTLTIRGNSAEHAGGGIYAEDTCLQSEPPCFFQLDIAIYKDPSLNATVHVDMINNTASYAGTAIYGGSVVYCYLYPQFVPDLSEPGADMFKTIFSISHSPTDLSPISSNPYKVCFCSENQTWPDCSVRSIAMSVYPGAKLTVSVFTVGQHDGSASNAVSASFKYPGSQLGDLEAIQDTHSNSCAQFTYTVFSQHHSEIMSLQVHQSGINNRASQRGIASVYITFKPCPVGFAISRSPLYKCNCIPALGNNYSYECDINKLVISKRYGDWIGCYALSHNLSHPSANQSNQTGSSSEGYGVRHQDHCPYDFCKDNKRSVKIHTGPHISDFDGNAQCAYHRAGKLCGACEHGYSLIFGSSECRKCTDDSFLSLILVFAADGALLVLLLIVTDLTVSSGVLSGLLYYANLVQINSSVFFGKYIAYRSVYVCSIFISWLNLDFGIKTCFYEGMDAYTKTWLQFAFPLYVWGIAVAIILLSRRFPSRYVAGRSPVRLLATLFLLSYAKLLRTIIRALSYTWLEQLTPDGQKINSHLVWTEDGNVDYLRGKHIALFVFAAGFGLVTLPYALVLFSLQWLLRGSHWRGCFWLVRLKPLFDAYTAPYKPHCRFWTGSLLLLRVLVFLAFALPHTDATVRLSFILTTCVVVQMIAWSLHGVFRSKYTDAINSVFFLNLGLFSAATSYNLGKIETHQATVIVVCVGSAFVLFVFILLFHTLTQARQMKTWGRLELWVRGKWDYWFPWFKNKRRRRRSERVLVNSCGEEPVSRTVVDPFDSQYREPLVSSDSSYSYGTTN